MSTPDLLQVSLGTTHGLRVSDAWFARLAEQAGVSVETVAVRIGLTDRLRRAYPVNDLVEAVAARRATDGALPRLRPRAVVFSTTTAALLAPDPGRPWAIRLDAPASMNRPGARNAVLHALERRRLAAATLVLPTSMVAAQALPAGSAPVVVLPPPVVVPEAFDSQREPLAVGYTPDPKAKGLDTLCAAWRRAEVTADGRLEVFGIEPERARRHLRRTGVPEPHNVVWRGLVSAEEFHAALGRCRTFITSARWEDFGMAQLEALALGAVLVCTATTGPFEAGRLARELRPELVAIDQSPEALGNCIERAFALEESEIGSYRRAAGSLLAPYRPTAITETIVSRVVPALLGGGERAN